jgi:hypothetical protein
MEVKNNKRIISFAVLILTFFVFLLPARAFDLNVFQKNNEGYFQKLHSYFPVYGNAVKLKDGRVLITQINFIKQPDNIIFDPKTNISRNDLDTRIINGLGKS